VLAKDWYEFVDLVFLGLKDTLCDPNHVPDFLLLEFDISVKYTKVKLAFEGQLEHLHIAFVEGVINALLTATGRVDIPNSGILWENLQNLSELVFIRDVGQHCSSTWVKVANCGVEALAVRRAHARFVQRGAERVECNVNRVRVSANAKDLSHDFGGVTAKLHYVLVEVFNPELDQRRLDDLNLNLLENLTGIADVGSLQQELCEVLSHWGIDEHSLVEVVVSSSAVFKRRDTAHGGFLEHTKRVTLFDKFVDITTGKGPLEQEHNILNHILVSNEIKELSEGLHCLSSQILKFTHKLFRV
jgi:hypothetical protein